MLLSGIRLEKMSMWTRGLFIRLHGIIARPMGHPNQRLHIIMIIGGLFVEIPYIVGFRTYAAIGDPSVRCNCSICMTNAFLFLGLIEGFGNGGLGNSVGERLSRSSSVVM